MTSTEADPLTTLASTAGRRDPYPVYARLRQQPPVYDERHRAWLVTGFNDCRRVLNDGRIGRPESDWFARRVPNWREHPALIAFSHMMTFAAPDPHARLRGVVKRAFAPRRMKKVLAAEAAAVNSLIDTLAERLRAGEEIDFQESVSYRVPAGTIARLLGAEEEDIEHVRDLTRYMSDMLEPDLSPDCLSRADEASVQLTRLFTDFIDRRRKDPRNDLISDLIAQQHHDRIRSDDELIITCMHLFLAGVANTTNLIGNLLAVLLERPADMFRLRAEPHLIPAALTEILRYDAPMQVTRRITLEPTYIGSQLLPAHADIAVVIGAANRDPDVHDAPDSFRIDRPPHLSLSFGGGAFYCIGAAMGRAEAELVLRALLTRAPQLVPAAPPTHNLRSVIRGFQTLPVRTDGTV